MMNKILLILLISIQPFSLIQSSSSCYAQNKNVPDLFTKGLNAIQEKDYVSAIAIYSKCRDLLNNENYNERAYCLYQLGICYYNLQEDTISKRYLENAYAVPFVDDKLKVQIENSLLEGYASKNMSKNMIDLLNTALIRFKTISTPLDKWLSSIGILSALNNLDRHEELISIADSLDVSHVDESLLDENYQKAYIAYKYSFYIFMGNYYYDKHLYDKSILSFKKALLVDSKRDIEELGYIYSNIARCYIGLEQFPEALKFQENAVDKYEQKANSLDDIFSTLYNNYITLSTLYEKNSCMDKCINILHKAESLCYKYKNKQCLIYCYSVLHDNYNQIGNMQLKDKYEKLLFNNIKDLQTLDNEELIISYILFAQTLKANGLTKKAIEAFERVIHELKNIKLDEKNLLIGCFSELYDIYKQEGNSEKAEYYANKIVEYPLEHSKIRSIINAKLYIIQNEDQKGNLGAAISMGEQLLPLINKSENNPEDFLAYHNMMGSLYAKIGNNDKAIEAFKQYADFCKKKYGLKSLITNRSLIDLGILYKSCNKYHEALECSLLAIKGIKQTSGINSKDYCSALNNLYDCYLYFRETSKANDVLLQMKTLTKSLYGQDSKEYARMLIKIGTDYLCSFLDSELNKNGDYPYFSVLGEKERDYYDSLEKGLRILINNKQDKSLTFIYNVYNFSCINKFLKRSKQALIWDKKLLEYIREYIHNNYHHLIDWERENLGYILQNLVRDSFVKMAVTSGSASYSTLAYDGCLLTKELQLNSVRSIDKLILLSGNSDLKNLHILIKREKEKLLFEKDSEKQMTITAKIEELQRLEIENVKKLGIITDFVDITYNDIQPLLKEDDVAIEFADYDYDNKKHYAALVLTPHIKSPIVFQLFDENQLTKYKRDGEDCLDYSNPGLYKLIWGSLETDILKHVKNVYFSAAGILNKIAIENMCDESGFIASQKWNLFRMSSTRNVLSESNIITTKNTILYGGLKYDMNISQLVEQDEYNTREKKADRFRMVNQLRGKAVFLPGSFYEIKGIENVLKGYNIPCSVYSGLKGTERSFKELTSDNINIIHLATHGFYCESQELNPIKNFIVNSNNDSLNMLLKSGLLFSGVNCLLSGQTIPSYIEDGILTSHEISLLNLRHVDLVVLSACQSGLGDVNEEGVFGLQRGFKLAGVKSLLMSLWKIDDKATALFMIEFYKNYINGKSKTESLKLAQQRLRDTKEYHDAKYWAGFILLDPN